MAFKDKLQKFIGDDKEGEVEAVSSDEFYKDAIKQPGISGNKMILLEPRAFSEAQTIADYLKSRNTVVVNLKRVTPEVAKRIVDFLSGALYAIEGDLQKLGNGIFLCTPNNVNVEGKITGERDTKKPTTTAKVENEEGEFDW